MRWWILPPAAAFPTPDLKVPGLTRIDETHFESHDFRLALVVRRRLDQDALAALLTQACGVRLIFSSRDLVAGMEACTRNDLDAAILDARFPDGDAFKAARIILKQSRRLRIGFFDDRLGIARATQSLNIPGALYFTRDDDLREVLRFLRLPEGSRPSTPDATLTPTLILDEPTLLRLDRYGIMKLSRREQEVMAELAQGKSVREVGENLKLSTSTIDNHKARAMKKLGIHRSSMLANVAISTGLID
jgi:DNA-binding NarL/FixJ family response regulator